MSSDRSISQAFAGFVSDTSWRGLGVDLKHASRRALVNSIGCAIGASQQTDVVTTVQLLASLSGPPHASVIGHALKLDVLSASFINAISANLFDYDDTHLATVIHPAAPVLPMCLALGEQIGASGAAVLEAYLIGAEVECRLGLAVSPQHYDQGWHITSTCGVFGAAAAAAKLLKLTPKQTQHAMGIAASQSAGVVQNLPTAAKNVGVGNGARNGLFAAMLAARGFAAAADAIEGPQGWARACGHVLQPSAVDDELGGRWEAANNTFKPYPSGIVMHAVIDACLQLRRANTLDADEIVKVGVYGDELLLARGDRQVSNARDAKVSIHHAAAAAFLWGRAGITEFSEVAVASPEAHALRARVTANLDANLPRGAARVEVETRRGDVHKQIVTEAHGGLSDPMTDQELENKFGELIAVSGLPIDTDGLLQKLWAFDEADCVVGLCDLLRSGNRA